MLMYEFYIPVPLTLTGVPDKVSTLNSFMPLYPGLDHLDGDNIVFIFNQEFNYATTEADIKSFLLQKYDNYVLGLNALQITTPDWLNGEYWDGIQWQCQN